MEIDRRERTGSFALDICMVLLGMGMNYFRDSFFERAEVTPCSYDEQRFKQFLAVYTDSLNSTYKKDLNVSQPDIEQKSSRFMQKFPINMD